MIARINIPAEDEGKGEHQVGNVPCGLSHVHASNDSNREGGGEQEEDLHEEPHEESADVDSVGVLRIAEVANRVVPT